MFVGRETELSLLNRRLDHIRRTRTGLAVAVRGRRQVGKSRLIQELCDRSGLPYLYFTAVKGASITESTAQFLTELASSDLPNDHALLPSAPSAGGWGDMLRVLAGTLPDQPCIVVLDELPWLAEQDDTFDGQLQVVWDRLLSNRPILLLLLGSDLHMMQRLTAYDRPFYGRADNLTLGPLDLAETAAATQLAGSDAIDAYLITGGLPGLLLRWPAGVQTEDYLRDEFTDPASPLFAVPEQSLASEFPNPDVARRALEAVGGDTRAFPAIANAAGNRGEPVSSGTLSPLLRQLTEDKQALAADQPLSATGGKPTLYRVADSSLRLYLAVLRDVSNLTRRGRPDAGYALFQRRWSTWRGRGVEPLIRASLEQAAISGSLPWPDVQTVGGWWNRQFNPEIDLVGADRGPVASRIHFCGSLKWLGTPFDGRDLHQLREGVQHVPGFDGSHAGLVVVSRSGADIPSGAVDVVWGPEDVVAAWRS
ncbi:ATP-binding protein [Paractinoplanes lichenicola]|uniref:ATP-binding protein n=1 Tax=Paractinoplanes lichenicola TaxID=2802976 RepID=A0ABS1VUA3_9ACTN|nr:ATP-binding protein [Actinoplanes lichenicola]MBL7258064.1 ATP-binding protein [Actinoplanes lichenicola]